MFITPSILTLSGPSGSGKTTVAGELLRIYDGARMVPSITTRAPRESDLPDEYQYVDDPTFDELGARGRFLWPVQPHGRTRYGTLTNIVRAACEGAPTLGLMILVPDVIETLHQFVRREYKDTARVLSIYIVQNDTDILRERLRNRSMSEPDIDARFAAEEDWFSFAIEDESPLVCVLGGDTLADLPKVVDRVQEAMQSTLFL